LALHKALEMNDPNEFIEAYSGRACAIKYSIPLIIHILYHTNSYEEAINYNALLGGAISDRNMIIGAIFAQVSEVPKNWRNKVADQIKL
ncbi:MAG: ADP-ribosylglycohydrolase family protein, partial [Candidatus Izemoplasmatales bacterium]|nr:ADP-ribosylglycohydrolase family protein [Candidatus Izemoplasmatales bacterium]